MHVIQYLIFNACVVQKESFILAPAFFISEYVESTSNNKQTKHKGRRWKDFHIILKMEIESLKEEQPRKKECQLLELCYKRNQ